LPEADSDRSSTGTPNPTNCRSCRPCDAPQLRRSLGHEPGSDAPPVWPADRLTVSGRTMWARTLQTPLRESFAPRPAAPWPCWPRRWSRSRGECAGVLLSDGVGHAGVGPHRRRWSPRTCASGSTAPLSSGGWLGSALVGQDAPVDDVGQAPLQRPVGLSRGLAFTQLAQVIGAGSRIAGLATAMVCRAALSWRLPPG
jgi:hypothetical protein